jgi:hypothetical protein
MMFCGGIGRVDDVLRRNWESGCSAEELGEWMFCRGIIPPPKHREKNSKAEFSLFRGVVYPDIGMVIPVLCAFFIQAPLSEANTFY